MKRPRRPDHTPRWPVALLLLAWLGASCPVNIVGMTVAWIGEAHSFSHQKRLTLDVARLLVGEKSPVAWTGSETLPPSPVKSAATGDGALRKIELALEESIESRLPGTTGAVVRPTSIRGRGALRPPPPQKPPRGAWVS